MLCNMAVRESLPIRNPGVHVRRKATAVSVRGNVISWDNCVVGECAWDDAWSNVTRQWDGNCGDVHKRRDEHIETS